jgi:hypothetical protein
MHTLARLSIAAALLSACASHEGASSDTSAEPSPQIVLRATIASVAIVQDCPDAAPAAPAPAPGPSAMEQPDPGPAANVSAGASLRRGDSVDGGGWSPPCTQSSIQLTLAHDGREPQRFAIKAARLTAAITGAQLGSIPVRGPSRWDDAGRYVAWDESLPAAAELKASYKLGEPNWSAVTKALGNDDVYGARYVLELDVEFSGRKITIRSPEFQREYPHVVVT